MLCTQWYLYQCNHTLTSRAAFKLYNTKTSKYLDKSAQKKGGRNPTLIPTTVGRLLIYISIDSSHCCALNDISIYTNTLSHQHLLSKHTIPKRAKIWTKKGAETLLWCQSLKVVYWFIYQSIAHIAVHSMISLSMQSHSHIKSCMQHIKHKNDQNLDKKDTTKKRGQKSYFDVNHSRSFIDLYINR